LPIANLTVGESLKTIGNWQSAIGNPLSSVSFNTDDTDASFLARKIVKLIDCFGFFSFAFSSLVV